MGKKSKKKRKKKGKKREKVAKKGKKKKKKLPCGSSWEVNSNEALPLLYMLDQMI